MNLKKRFLLLVSALLVASSFSACTLPLPGFDDYDVSSYVKAFLDSSYLQKDEDFIAITASTREGARQNNADTIENASVVFCNTYGISPSEEQMTKLRQVMQSVYRQAKYTVKEERRTEEGYYLEVEISPITNFNGRSADLEKLKTEAEAEAAAANREAEESSKEPEEEGDDEYDEYGEYDEYDEYDEEEEPEPIATPMPAAPVKQVDPKELFVDKVIAFCEKEAGAISYNTPVSISLDILQTAEGELQIDMNQINTIDRTVLYLNA